MASEEKSQVRKRSLETKEEGKVKRKRSRNHKKKTKKKKQTTSLSRCVSGVTLTLTLTLTTSLSRCVPGALEKVSDFMGMKNMSEKMKKIKNRNYNFEQVVTAFKKGSHFRSEKVLCSTFDPLFVDPEHIFLCQICSVHVDDHTLHDNFHSVVLFDNKIFDINIEKHLFLTKDNLNRCCLGDKWVYDHCSRIKRFSVKKEC